MKTERLHGDIDGLPIHKEVWKKGMLRKIKIFLTEILGCSL